MAGWCAKVMGRLLLAFAAMEIHQPHSFDSFGYSAVNLVQVSKTRLYPKSLLLPWRLRLQLRTIHICNNAHQLASMSSSVPTGAGYAETAYCDNCIPRASHAYVPTKFQACSIYDITIMSRLGGQFRPNFV